MTPPHTDDSSAARPLSLRFKRFLVANLISATGSAIAPIALAFAVLDTGGGAKSLGVVLASNTVPMVLFLVAGGVVADRMSRSTILFWGNVVAGAVQTSVAIVVATNTASTGALAALAFVSGTASAFIVPASQGIVKQLVEPSNLQRANALVRLPSNAVRVAGPVLGGILVAVLGPEWALAWDALTFLAAAILLLGLKVDAPLKIRRAVLTDLRAGWNGFRERTWLWTYTLFGTLVVAAWLAGFQLLGPSIARDVYSGAGFWGIVEGGLALGLLSGTLVSLRWKPDRLLAVSVIGCGGLALPLLMLAIAAPIGLVVAAAIVAGIGLDLSIVCWSTALQQHVDDSLVGRLTSFNSIGERVAIPLGYVLAGLASSAWGSRGVALVCAGIIVLATAGNLLVRDVYRIRRVGPTPRVRS